MLIATGLLAFIRASPSCWVRTWPQAQQVKHICKNKKKVSSTMMVPSPGPHSQATHPSLSSCLGGHQHGYGPSALEKTRPNSQAECVNRNVTLSIGKGLRVIPRCAFVGKQRCVFFSEEAFGQSELGAYLRPLATTRVWYGLVQGTLARTHRTWRRARRVGVDPISVELQRSRVKVL